MELALKRSVISVVQETRLGSATQHTVNTTLYSAFLDALLQWKHVPCAGGTGPTHPEPCGHGNTEKHD